MHALLTFLTIWLAAAPYSGLSEASLPSLHGGSDTLALHRGHVVVAMVVTARRLREIKSWETALRERYDDLRYVRIADVPVDPPVTFEQVAKKLRGRVPEDVDVLIDLDRLWATTLDLDTQRTNVLVFDRQGRLAGRFRGKHGREVFDQVRALVDSLGVER